MTTTEDLTSPDAEAQAREQYVTAADAAEDYLIAPTADPQLWPAAHSDEDDHSQDEDDHSQEEEDGHGHYGGSRGAEPVDLDGPHDPDSHASDHTHHDPHLAAPAQAGAADPRGDDGDDADTDGPPDPGRDRPRRFDSRVAFGFAGVLIAAVVLAVVASTMFYGGSDKKVAVRQATTVADPAVAVPEPPAPTPDQPVIGDRPLPYTADASGSCPAGSTSAQTMAGADPRNAFVCVRDGIDGQVIDIDLSKTYVITAISLTPGWIGQDASGATQWSQHRVVTTVQYAFNDTERTMITQDTKNVHGEAVMPVQRVLASKVRMLIRQTSRPPVDVATSAAPSPDLLPGLPTPPTFAGDPLFAGGKPNSDPVDHTFAVSSLKIIGHEPL